MATRSQSSRSTKSRSAPRTGRDAQEGSAEPDNGAGPENLDKVRDILFGGQMRAYETRLARLEERLMRELHRMRETLEQRLDKLETYVNAEFEATSTSLTTEKRERMATREALEQKVRDAETRLDERLDRVHDALRKTGSELRRQMLDESKAVTTNFVEQTDALASQVNRDLQDLRLEKTDTASLATLLNEMAMRLTEEFEFPAEE